MCHLDYPKCETLNHWRSFDAHFHDGAGIMSLLLLPIKEANTPVMTISNQSPLWLPRMQDLKWSTLRWCSFPGWGSELFCTYFNHKGGQYIHKQHQHSIIIILRFTVGYLNATITRQPKMQNQISDQKGLATPGETCGWTGTGLHLDGREAAGQVFGLFWNQIKPFSQSKPLPLAGYPDPLLSIVAPGFVEDVHPCEHV